MMKNAICSNQPPLIEANRCERVSKTKNLPFSAVVGIENALMIGKIITAAIRATKVSRAMILMLVLSRGVLLSK